MSDSSRWLFDFRLRDGTPIVFGPVVPDDKERVRVGIARLSRTSRYLRFFSGTAQLSEQQLDYLVNVDQVNHVAWGAMDPAEPGLSGLGLGRFVREPEQPDSAEMAIAVVDDLQGRGLGTALLGLLYLSAQERRLKSLRSLVLPENDVTCQWLASLGAVLRNRGDHFEAELPVAADLKDLPQTASAERFARVIGELRMAMVRTG